MEAKGKGNTKGNIFQEKCFCLETVTPSFLAFHVESDFPSICQQMFTSLLHSNTLHYLLWQD